MNAVYVSNENYARHLGVSLCSLYDRNREEKTLDVWIIDTGISDLSRAKLKMIATGYGRLLRFCQLTDLRERFRGELDTGSFDISTMGRLFVGELLPESAERVLYLDCDTVVLRSLRKLWQMPLDGAVMAAAQEPTIYPQVRDYLGLEADDAYYNAGVLLIDLKRWRAEGIREKVLAYYESIAEVSLFNDQDALNGLLKGRIRTFSPEYNFFTNYRYFRYETLCGMQSAYREIPEKQFRLAKRHPAVLHFAGDERPWRAGALNFYGAAYEKYLNMTPWAGTPKETGKELYLLAYHGMELMTVVSPGLRAAVSNAYVEKLIRERQERRAERESAAEAEHTAGPESAVKPESAAETENGGESR